MVENSRNDFEKRNHWEGHVGEGDKLEQSKMAFMYAKTIIESISLSTNSENSARQAEKGGDSVIKSYLLTNGTRATQRNCVSHHTYKFSFKRDA